MTFSGTPGCILESSFSKQLWYVTGRGSTWRVGESAGITVDASKSALTQDGDVAHGEAAVTIRTCEILTATNLVEMRPCEDVGPIFRLVEYSGGLDSPVGCDNHSEHWGPITNGTECTSFDVGRHWHVASLEDPTKKD